MLSIYVDSDRPELRAQKRLWRCIPSISKENEPVCRIREWFKEHIDQIEIDTEVERIIYQGCGARFISKDTKRFISKYGNESNIEELPEAVKACVCIYSFPKIVFDYNIEDNIDNYILLLTLPRGRVAMCSEYMPYLLDGRITIGCAWDRKQFMTKEELPIIQNTVRMVTKLGNQPCKSVYQACEYIKWYNDNYTEYKDRLSEFYRNCCHKHALTEGIPHNVFEISTYNIFLNDCKVRAAKDGVRQRDIILPVYEEGAEEKKEAGDKKWGEPFSRNYEPLQRVKTEIHKVQAYKVAKRYAKEITRREKARLGFSGKRVPLYFPHPTQEQVMERIRGYKCLTIYRNAKMGLLGDYAKGTENKNSIIEVAYWPQGDTPACGKKSQKLRRIRVDLNNTFYREVVIHDYRRIQDSLRHLQKPKKGFWMYGVQLTEEERNEQIAERELELNRIENETLWIEPGTEEQDIGLIAERIGGELKEEQCKKIERCAALIDDDVLQKYVFACRDIDDVITGKPFFQIVKGSPLNLSKGDEERIKKLIKKKLNRGHMALCKEGIQYTIELAGYRNLCSLDGMPHIVKALAFDLQRWQKVVEATIVTSSFDKRIRDMEIERLSPSCIIDLALELVDHPALEGYSRKHCTVLKIAFCRNPDHMYFQLGDDTIPVYEGHEVRIRNIEKILDYDKRTGKVSMSVTTENGENANKVISLVDSLVIFCRCQYAELLARDIETVELMPYENL